MKKQIIPLLAAALLALSACSGRAEPDTPLVSTDKEALFPYYTLSGNTDYYYYGGSPYGLMNAQGEFVLPMEYQSIYEVETLPYDAYESGELPRYWVVQVYEDLTDEQREAAALDGYVDLSTVAALASPSGELMTGFDYRAIYRLPGEERFVARHVDGRMLWLEADGRTAPLDDADLEYQLALSTRWSNMSEYWAGMSRTGPDVPEEGFFDIIELPDGRYWGAYNNYDSYEEVDGKGDMQRYSLFSADGVMVGTTSYHQFDRINTKLYVGIVFNADDGTYLSYLIDENGIPYHSEPYEWVQHYNTGDCLLAYRDGTTFVFTKDGLEQRGRFEIDDSTQLQAYQAHGRSFVALASFTEPLKLLFFDEQGGELVLEHCVSYQFVDCNESFDRFLVSNYVDWENDPDPRYIVALVDADGSFLLDERENMYCSRGVLLDYESFGDNWNNTLTGVYDWDGNVLLPNEYRQVTTLGGGYFHVQRGDWTGVVDSAGNWIYRESIFTRME